MSKVTPHNGLPTAAQAVQHLRACMDLLMDAQTEAEAAEQSALYGARITRCRELQDLIADAIGHASRLGVVALGDARAEL
jgi:hypothetical protein